MMPEQSMKSYSPSSPRFAVPVLKVSDAVEKLSAEAASTFDLWCF
jgi:hypothetical protein